MILYLLISVLVPLAFLHFLTNHYVTNRGTLLEYSEVYFLSFFTFTASIYIYIFRTFSILVSIWNNDYKGNALIVENHFSYVLGVMLQIVLWNSWLVNPMWVFGFLTYFYIIISDRFNSANIFSEYETKNRILSLSYFNLLKKTHTIKQWLKVILGSSHKSLRALNFSFLLNF